jgi:Ino eighty subunit 1
MKTALRTYNPVPSLQKSAGSAQDAPRIKSALKGAFFPDERAEGRPLTLQDVHRRLVRHPARDLHRTGH